MIDDFNWSPFRGFVRPVLVLAGCVFAVALLLLPFAWGRIGSGGPLGLAVAGAICLIAGCAAEGLSFVLRRRVAPLNAMLLSMAVRIVPPLGICLVLAARRVDGRDHLAFIAYLLVFYLATLAVETWLAVKRVSHSSSHFNHNAR
jgi:hypothetical protein